MSAIVWFTGMSGAGKSTIAQGLASALERRGIHVNILDGDVVRNTLHRHLGFSPDDIRENNRLVAKHAMKVASESDVVLVPIISPFADSRDHARNIIGDGFVEVYVRCPEHVREARDPKGLYERARSGQLTNLIGYNGDVPYEPPENPDVLIDTSVDKLEDAVVRIERFLDEHGLIQ